MENFKKALFIYNPKSGHRKVASSIDKIAQRFFEHNVVITPIRFEEGVDEYLPRVLKELDYDFVVGSGGDGSIDGIARFMLENGIKKPYAVIGGGTCNNFASNLNMPVDIYEAIDEICKLRTEFVDIGVLETGEVFLSSFAVGVFAETSFETKGDLKEWIGPLAYHLNGITKLKDLRVNTFTIKTEQGTIEESGYMIVVLNGNNVGNMTGVLENIADMQDGLFELLIIREANPKDIANLLVKVVKGEDFTQCDFITIVMANSFEVDSSDRTLGVSLDGEEGPKLPVKFRVVKQAMEVIVGR